MKGFISSIQTLGTVDGPGVRFVIFMQGCNLRCGCCHNPETWEIGKGECLSAEELIAKAVRYKEYFGDKGGITLSGGEPLLQAEFATELFRLAHENGLNTCLDTSGSVMNEQVKALLSVTDYILLDIKYTNDADYLEYAGCSMSKPLEFLAIANEIGIKTRLRQVIIPTLNDDGDNILKLRAIANAHDCVEKIELLPFKKLCSVKYEQEGKTFRFADIDSPSAKLMERLNALLN